MNTAYNKLKYIFAIIHFAAAMFADVSAQSYQIIGTKVYSLKEGDSVKIVIKNLQNKYQNVSLKIVNPDPNHLHFTPKDTNFSSLNLYPVGMADSAVINVTYYPKALHPITAQIYLSDFQNIQFDTITIFSKDTSDGHPDPLRTKEYLSHYSSDTLTLYTSKRNVYLNHINLQFRSKTSDTIKGYIMTQSKSGNIKTDPDLFFDKFSLGPFSFTVYYSDAAGYGNHDTATVILYPIIPRDAKPDTVVIYELDNEMYLSTIQPDFNDVPKGVKTCRLLKIINNNDSVASITSITVSGDVANFSVGPGVIFPFRIRAHSDTSIFICYSAPDSDRASSEAEFAFLAKTFDDHIISTGLSFVTGSTDFGCFSVSKDTLSFRNIFSGNSIEDSVMITNRLTDSVEFLNGIWTYLNPPDSNLFSIVNKTFPLLLAPGESKYIHFTFKTKQNQTGKFYGLVELEVNRDWLYRKGSDTLCGNRSVEVIANSLNSFSVGDILGQIPNITIIPNPAHEQVMIRALGIRPAFFEIYNVLGERIAEKNKVTEWLWNSGNEGVADGIYFVRVSGESDDGRSFVTTKKIILKN